MRVKKFTGAKHMAYFLAFLGVLAALPGLAKCGRCAEQNPRGMGKHLSRPFSLHA